MQQVCPCGRGRHRPGGGGPAAAGPPLTIRRTLLLAFVAVGLLPALLLGLLAFERARGVLQAEIERSLALQSEVMLSEIGQLLFERLQNADTWRRIELMQDLQVGDVDKRLAGFLQRLQAGYGGLYRELAAVDRGGRIVASSDAGRIGRAGDPPAPGLQLQQAGAAFTLEPPRRDERGTVLTLRAPVASAFGGPPLGELLLQLDVEHLDRRLERVAAGGRLVALLDAQGRLVAGSRSVLDRLPRGRDDLAPWTAASPPSGTAPPGLGPVLVGAARGPTAVAALGWQVLVLAPRDEALAPVRSMALVFGLLLALVAALTLAAAGGVSQAIARPIAALTAFSRSHRHGEPLPAALASARGEVGELARAYADRLAEIDASQRQLARASALAAVGEMAAVIAHEVRTPLGVVLSSAQILQREPQQSAEGRELLGFIESETARLARLIATLLEGARPHEPRLAPIDLNALVEHAVALLGSQASARQVAVEVAPDAAAAPLDCDAEQMTQVLLNLLLNALQILEPGGRIAVSLHDQGPQVVIDIADDGPGIAPEARERVFEAFFFQREGGIGLGLAVVQRIVTAHGGRVEVARSALGGALFRVILPRGPRRTTE